MVFLDPIRSALPPTARKRAYDIATAIIAGLGMVGVVDTTAAAQWTSVAVAAIALVFAVLYSATTARAAFYTLIASVMAVLGGYDIVTDNQTAALLGVAVAVLGVAVAGSNTPQVSGP